MTYTFTDKLPENIDMDPVLITGHESTRLKGKEYLLIQQSDDNNAWYEIRYEAHCSPFKEVIISDSILALGHEEHFYLFDLISKTTLLRLKMSGYFGHLYFANSHFYVTCACGLFSITKQGQIIWQNLSLGIDGIIVTGFTENKVYGSGDCDPPGGWKDFILDCKTGIDIG